MVVEARPKVLLLMGPTAAGKTDLAVELAENFNMEIISVDSALIYREMDIGTAKPDAETLMRTCHHLIDIRDPAESYSAAEFFVASTVLIRDILVRGKIPLMVGGTMLYYRAIMEGLSKLPKADEAVRQRLLCEAEERGWLEMHRQLKRIDPQSASRIHPNDRQRIQRALEVYCITGDSMSDWIKSHQPGGLPYDFIKIAVSPEDRLVLHRRIENRFDNMLKQGFIDEVDKLKKRADLDLDKPSMRCVGYRQIWQYLDGEYSKEEARLRGIYASRQLAKRQLTWLRSIGRINWFDWVGDVRKSAGPVSFVREVFAQT